MDIYYLYFYLRSDYTPYYVGKGKDNRAYKKAKDHNIKVPKNKSHIIILHDNLSELQSLILERYYIRWFGRKDNGTGILRNLTDGGEGTSGRTYSDKTKSLISQRVKETMQYTTCPYCGKIIDSANYKRYHGDKCGQTFTNTKTSIKLSKKWMIVSPDGNNTIISNLYRFCVNHPDNLNQAALHRVASGKQKSHKGWKCYYYG